MKEQNPTRKDESIKTDNEICEMCAKESEEPEKNIEQEETGCCCHCKTTARSQDERKIRVCSSKNVDVAGYAEAF